MKLFYTYGFTFIIFVSTSLSCICKMNRYFMLNILYEIMRNFSFPWFKIRYIFCTENIKIDESLHHIAFSMPFDFNVYLKIEICLNQQYCKIYVCTFAFIVSIYCKFFILKFFILAQYFQFMFIK